MQLAKPYDPYPENAALARELQTLPNWQTVSAQFFQHKRCAILRAGGSEETNERGTLFLFLGTRTVANRPAPLLVGHRLLSPTAHTLDMSNIP